VSSLNARVRAHVAVPLHRSAYALMSSVVATSALGFIFWGVASRTYSAHAVGVASATLAALTFLTGIGGLYLDGALYRFLPRAGAATDRLVLLAALGTVVSATIVAIGFLIGLHVWAPDLAFLRSAPWVVVAAVLSVVGSCLLVLVDGALIGLRRAGWVPIKGVAYGVAKLAVLIVCVPLVPRYGIVVAWVVPIAAVLLGSAFLLRTRLIPHNRTIEAEQIRPGIVVRYAAGNYAGFLCNLAYRTLPPLLVIHELGAKSNAYFYVPWLIATSLLLLTNNLSTSLVVEGSLDPQQLRLQTRRALLQFIRLLFPISAVILIAAPLILRIFGKGYASHGSSLLRLLALALIPAGIGAIASGVARVRDHVGVIIATQLGLAIVVLGLGIVFLHVIGLEGLGVSWLIGQTLAATWLTFRELRPVLRRPERPRQPPLADYRLELLEEEMERMEQAVRERLGRLDYGGGAS
jgi:O-antigen/teichoic acid export membrane protein